MARILLNRKKWPGDEGPKSDCLVPSWLLELSNPGGADVAANWVNDSGENLPAFAQTEEGVRPLFDLPRLLRQLREEQFLSDEIKTVFRLPFHHHLLPGRIRMTGMRWLVSRRLKSASRYEFPAWPLDVSADVLHRLGLLCGLFEQRPAWPGGKSFAIVLTHDVDTAQGQQFVPQMAEWDEAEGINSAWYVVGSYYDIDHHMLSDLESRGHEIGLHGAVHDNRLADLDSEAIRERLDSCNDFVQRHSISGFRSPSFRVSPALYDQLAGRFGYDSSVPDTDIASPWYVRRGCCTVFPYRRNGLLVIPPTLPPEDKCISLGMSIEETKQLWMDKVKNIRQQGGLVCAVIHSEPHLWSGREREKLYRWLTGFLAQQEDAWITTPNRVMELYSSWNTDG